jgi:hypothetical protein
MFLRLVRLLVQLRVTCWLNHFQGTSKVPSVVSGDLEETVDLNASFDNT